LLTYAGDQCGIWVDWNHDFDFADAGETIPVTGTPGIGPYTANITPPVNAVKGLTRMRIRIMWAGTLSSCGTTSYGEVEDYSLYVGTPGLWVGGTPYYPQDAGTFNCLDLQIKDGAAVIILPGSSLNVNGNLQVGQGASGVMVIDGGTCNVSGAISTAPGSSITIINNGTVVENN
jgi:hypothetical protein